MPEHSPPSTEPSVAALLGGIVNDAKELLLQEFRMAKLEVQEELQKTKRTAISFGIGIGIGAIGVFLLSFMLVYLLNALTDVPLWGCYGIIGGVFTGVGLVLLYAGKKEAEDIHVVPQQTIETLKENAKWLKEQTPSDRV